MSEELAVCIFTVTDAGFWGDFTASRTIMGAAGTVSVCDAGFWSDFTASRMILAASGIFSVCDAGFWGDFAASRMIVAADRDARKDNRGWLSVNKTFSHPLFATYQDLISICNLS